MIQNHSFGSCTGCQGPRPKPGDNLLGDGKDSDTDGEVPRGTVGETDTPSPAVPMTPTSLGIKSGDNGGEDFP